MTLAFILRYGTCVLMLMLPLLASAAGKCERIVATGAADNPPFLWRDPQQPERLLGANAELLQRLADSLGLKLDLLYSGDASQALDEVRSGRIDVLLDARQVADRLPEGMDFIYPTIAQLQVSPWIAKARPFDYAGQESLIGHKGVLAGATGLGQPFDAFAREYLDLRTVADTASAVNELVAGNADYLLLERYSAAAMQMARGQADELIMLEPPILMYDMHLAISHESACNDSWLRSQLALKMAELQATGLPQELLKTNLERWLERQKTSGVVNQDPLP
ncbi:substrate-binding periplasmic protein [Azomonas macrocytogenes]|uniref:ABC-type amino acid transport substrate-binding protein n=1 Tax=Azomonas macrocytogenes TaxID=69962 RepID=A0A839SYT1_AZOMA|nr:transporter substrate-binding domain-containing protein [Azomonas macrocytogenes]MBB3101849.1 ABC-type amino acid transport substrate-binding protein [Azomonas macrocytogenes]